MIKARNKRISLLLAIVFVLTLVLPMGSAFAADTVTWTNTVNKAVVADGTTQNVLGYIKAAIDSEAQLSATDAVYFTVQLPDDVEFAAAPDGTNISSFVSGSPTVDAGGSDKDTLKGYVAGNVSSIQFNFATTNASKVIVDAAFEGDIEVSVKLEAVAFVGGVATTAWTAETKKVIGVVSDKALTVSAGTVVSIKSSGTPQQVADITFEENKAGAAVGQVIYAELPDSLTWASYGNLVSSMGLSATVNGIGTDTLEIVFSGTPSGPTAGSLKLDNPTINVGPGASEGDVVVQFTAKSGSVFEATDLVVAKIGETSGTFTRYDDTSDKLYPGRKNQNVDGIKMKFSAKLSLNDQIWLELPEGAAFGSNYGTATGLTGKGRYKVSGDENRGAWFIVSTASDEYTIKGIDVTLDADFAPGDLVVKVKGDVGPAEVVLGEVIAPFTATAEKTKVNSNGFEELGGKITLTEAVKDAFISGGEITLTVGKDIKFAAAPKYTINGGSETKMTRVDDQTYKMSPSFSNRIDTIEIYNIKYDVGTRVTGDIEVEIGGSAVNTLDGSAAGDALATVVNATVGTGTVSASFKVGDAGVAVVNGRTLVQVNKLNEVLGLSKSWDAAAKTAYFIKDGKVVAFPIGKNVILINGVTVPVDQGGKIIDGATYATLRGLEMAFGGKLSWDAATKTANFEF
ncbi:copper amine oxidase N-terminal domain-containing protein [Desulforudis sp. DRI-14]|uniref:copper amine oxidase N-terminal domain-containing protein n=1 Tax=Desulforudis sp. DRI-14 TaxID=3459793 RepID=UPI004042F44C